MLNKLVLSSGYYYLATPYSKYHLGIEVAADHACLIAAELMRRGVPVFSPIAHTHQIAIAAGIDPLAHDFWMAADGPMMTAAHGLIVARMQGWQESRGVREEIETFTYAEKPVVYLDPSALGVDVPNGGGG